MSDYVPDPAIGEAFRRGLVIQGFKVILSGLYGEGWADDPHLKDTPERAAKAWTEELCRGLREDALPKITVFPHEREPGMVLLRDIPVKSMCAHHLLPFVGTAAVAYIGGSRKLLGLSKLSRIVDYWSRRPQVQEVLTANIADHLFDLVGGDGGGVGVVVRASHMCMALRGVNHTGEMTTSELRGVFDAPEVRAEFFHLVGDPR